MFVCSMCQRVLFDHDFQHWVLDVVRCFDGFIDEANKPLGTLLYFLTPANPKYLAETSLYIVQGIVPDM